MSKKLIHLYIDRHRDGYSVECMEHPDAHATCYQMEDAFYELGEKLKEILEKRK